MAYGVKYRLEFSDVLGNGKKVEILKKDYTGEVFPMIGSASPVKISWQSSDDFYKPIIGSKCTLSLLVTDEISYDDFYRFDEREYKVVVYYAKSQTEIINQRILDDDGIIEATECLDNLFQGFGTISDFYQNRVIIDDGIVESLSCFSNAIDDSVYYEWQAYWSGYLVVDRYIEKLTTKPYGVTFNAYDGLGTLNNFTAPVKTDYDGTGVTVYYKDAERIALILDNLDLDLEVHYINDIAADKITAGTPGLTFFPQFRSIEPGLTEQINGYDIPLAKDQLSLLLSTYNMRIFQSMNKWYVVEATNVFDKYVKDMIFNEVSVTGVAPTGIRNKITEQLNNFKKEFLKVYKYGTDGIYDKTYIENVLFEAPAKLKPVKSDLSVEYLQGINKVITESKNLNNTKGFFNAGFEYGESGFNLVSSNAFIAENGIAYQGNNSIASTDVDPFDRPSPSSTNTLFELDTLRIDPVADSSLLSEEIKKYNLSFQYYLHMDTSEDEGIENQIGFVVRARSFAVPTSYYDYDLKNNRWNNYNVTNYIQQTDFNKWKEIEFDFDNTDLGFADNTIIDLEISINGVTVEEAYKLQYLGIYYDNVILKYEDNTRVSEKTATSSLQNGKFLTSNKKINRLYQEGINIYKRSRDSYGTQATTNLFKDNYSLQNQNIANHFREFVSRYSGTFRVNQIIPFSMHNKIWFNWENSESDPQSTILDGLTYDLKESEIKIKSHLPNDDDDVPIETVIK